MKKKFISFCVYLAIAAFTISSLNLACAQSTPLINTVVPNGLANAEGNSSSWDPLYVSATGMRYQQVFDASQFSAIANGGGTIRFITFRLDGSCGGNEPTTISNLQVDLSTTTKGPDSLGPVFADNVGSDDTMVFGPKSTYQDDVCGPDLVKPFDTLIRFDRPFFYNPNQGNLLLDIHNYSGHGEGGPLILDGENVTGDSISRIVGGNAFSTVGHADSFGLVVNFGVEAVPEPSTWALLALGLGGLALAKTWRFT